jgi:hypothetical protein
MAISFSKLRDPRLGLQDKITFGKLRDCRVCDCIQDHYEYLIWAEKSGYIKFQPIVVETLQEHAGYKDQQRHYEEEVKPWVEPDVLEDDVPF